MRTPHLLRTLHMPLAGLLLTLAATAHAGPWRADPDNSRGWELMSPAERIEHQRRLRSFTDYEACRAYQQAHHAQLEARAQTSGRRPVAGYTFRLPAPI